MVKMLPGRRPSPIQATSEVVPRLLRERRKRLKAQNLHQLGTFPDSCSEPDFGVKPASMAKPFENPARISPFGFRHRRSEARKGEPSAPRFVIDDGQHPVLIR
jgi:hypothetical protein